jgi:aminoglycoside/choline kinase family phosphotransferase
VIDAAPLEALVRKARGQVQTLTPMPGGASTRQFVRVAMTDGRRAVGMFVPGADRPEESVHDLAARPRWPFLEVRDLLEARGVRVPALLGEDCDRGWLLVEDLGDDTLAARIAAHPGERASLYTKAARDLAVAQGSLGDLPKGSVVAGRSFDAELLFWELEHFREWGLDARGKKLADADRARFDAIARTIAGRIGAWPRGFTHRDYQSRNIMVVAGELAWIDFQDALLGPRAYDLVALLCDSYQTFDAAFIQARLDDYADAAALGAADRRALRFEFDLLTVQRKLKDAGRFVFIERVKGNPSFLPYIEPSLGRVKDALVRLAPHDADLAELQTTLRRVLPESF